MRIFLALILNFVLFQCWLCRNSKILVKIFFDWTIMGGVTIIPCSPKITRNEKNFQDRPKIFLFFKSYMTLKYLLIIDFPKFDPLTAAEMALCVNLGPNFFFLQLLVFLFFKISYVMFTISLLLYSTLLQSCIYCICRHLFALAYPQGFSLFYLGRSAAD